MSKEDIVIQITQVQQALDSVTMQIGKEYAIYAVTNNEQLRVSINANVDVRHQLEIRLDTLKRELLRLS